MQEGYEQINSLWRLHSERENVRNALPVARSEHGIAVVLRYSAYSL